ncbi:MAG: carboxypeptidase-like regulatory domain-containing protein [Flavobacteriales bacterium]|nr:carboxypeptidase-like regulatory domain-containing protein [Flavobacteriales bacterium]
MRNWLIGVFFLPALGTCAQALVQGVVVDSRSNKPLAFVHLVELGARQGTTTDIDGRFRIRVDALPVTLKATYVGYEPLEVRIEAAEAQVLKMEPKAYELEAVEVFPGENPAHRIIRRAYAARKENDGMNNREHRYDSYAKTVFTAALDSALMFEPERVAALDSNDREVYEFFERQHVLLIESVTERKFIPPSSAREEVKAMRVSGLQNPQLLALAAETRTWSIYAPAIELGQQRFIGPLAPGSTRDYLFLLKDTLYQGADSVFVISFAPRAGKRFEAMKGLLYIHTDGYAVQNVIAEPKEPPSGIGIRVQQVHSKIDGIGWFPVQMNNTLILEAVQVEDWKIMGVSRVYLKDIDLRPGLTRRDVSGPELVADRMELRRDAAIWDSVRVVPLDAKDSVTYHTIDSLGKAQRFDRRLWGLTTFLRGSVAYKFLEFPLDRLFRYNGYEGFRLGAGVYTNARFSRVVRFGGYWAYGLRDRTQKYGGDLTFSPWPNRGHEIRFAYGNDVAETGGWVLPGRSWSFGPESYRWLYVDRMDRSEVISATIGLQLAEGLKVWAGTESQLRRNEQGYRYREEVGEGLTVLGSGIRTGAMTFGLRFAYRERTARLTDQLVNLGTRGPVLHVLFWRAFDGLWEGEQDTWRGLAQVEKKFQFKRRALTLRVLAGLADEKAPMPYLFNLRGTYSSGLAMASSFVFETMRPNEFLADRFVAGHARFGIGHVLYESKSSTPDLSVLASAAWGGMSRPELHQGLSFTPLNAPYFEAGLQVDDILRSGLVGLGIGGFYRFGDQAFGSVSDDLALKLTVKLGI